MVESREDWGYVGRDPEITEKIRQQLSQRDSIGLNVLEAGIRTGLREFPLFDRGMIFSEERGKEFLHRIEQTGVKLQPYSHLDRRQLWTYIESTKEIIKRIAETHFPQVLREVNAENASKYLTH